MWFNPRFGWQCHFCWDGLIQRDQILQPIFPYEGTRKTPAPIVDSLMEGVTPGTLYQTYVYNLRDRATGLIYAVRFQPMHIGPGGSIVLDTAAVPTLTLLSSTDDPVYKGLVLSGNYAVIVVNGALTTEKWLYEQGYLNNICDFGEGEPLGTYLLYDRSHPENIYEVVFHELDDATAPGQIEVIPASGPAVGGILLNENWVYFIDEDQANHDQAPWPDLIVWDNSHTFYVDNATEELIYVP